MVVRQRIKWVHKYLLPLYIYIKTKCVKESAHKVRRQGDFTYCELWLLSCHLEIYFFVCLFLYSREKTNFVEL